MNHTAFMKNIKAQFIQRDMKIILELLKQTNKKIFSDIELGMILNKYKKLAKNDENFISNISRKIFIDIMVEEKIVEKLLVESSLRNINRYIFKPSNIYEKALSLTSKSYLSHYTAVFIHGLTLNVPKVIYINSEQSQKKNKTEQLELRQINIDKAFSREFRRSNNIAYLKEKPHDVKVIILNGKYMENSNIEYLEIGGSLIPITDIERTLMDIAVRPEYSGGVVEVINIFKNAIFSIDRLIGILDNADYIYPYHQVLGFYLELAGYPESSLKLFDHYDLKYNFYLNYKMIAPSFSKRWKIYYPNHISY